MERFRRKFRRLLRCEARPLVTHLRPGRSGLLDIPLGLVEPIPCPVRHEWIIPDHRTTVNASIGQSESIRQESAHLAHQTAFLTVPFVRESAMMSSKNNSTD
jgi:hypothetical protein